MILDERVYRVMLVSNLANVLTFMVGASSYYHLLSERFIIFLLAWWSKTICVASSLNM